MFDFLLLASAILFISIDFVYLNVIRDYFTRQIQSVQGSQMKVNYLGAALCYIFLIAGINYFIIRPRKSVSDAFLLGIVIYGVYETTNYALFTNWSIWTVLIDTLWGGLLFAATTYAVNLLRTIL
ncbi:MAG: DUF2177 family protein [Candidatus Marinimicrobia bacterium]|jgi:uncharacterized membrane protein|nr:DUF2177 family protein [Candidatus Neomarinimicrobiota bacterium]